LIGKIFQDMVMGWMLNFGLEVGSIALWWNGNIFLTNWFRITPNDSLGQPSESSSEIRSRRAKSNGLRSYLDYGLG
jgi:hypothetical protein